MTSRGSMGWLALLALVSALPGVACSQPYKAADPLMTADAPPADGDSATPTPALDATPNPMDVTKVGGGPTVRCDPTLPFVSVTDVAGFVYPEGNYGPPRISADELSLYVSMQDTAGDIALYAATRTSREVAFGAATPLAGMTAGAHGTYLSPNLSSDGLTLVYEGIPGTAQSSTSIFLARRPSMVSTFGAATPLDLGVTNSREPFVIAGANAVYFGDGHLHRADLSALGTASGVTALTELTDATDGSMGERFPVVRADELAIYWQASKQGGTVGTADLYVATRSSKSEPFGAIRAVTEVSSPTGDEYASMVSPDGCRVYVLTFEPNGGSPLSRLRVATLAE